MEEGAWGNRMRCKRSVAALRFHHMEDVKTMKLMGILNVTPDSFYDGGRHLDARAAIARAREMSAQGADIIDIGGESSRPNAEPVTEEEELRRILPVLRSLNGSESEKPEPPFPPFEISLDTYKPEVARAGLGLGVSMLNDITGMRDGRMRELAAEHGCKCVLMHMLGNPKTMQLNPEYEDVVSEIIGFFGERRDLCLDSGIKKSNLVYDPGIGFGKTPEHNVEILRGSSLREFRKIGPVLIGASRKSFMGKLFGTEGQDRLYVSLAIACHCKAQGVDYLRVHDVKETKLALAMMDELG